MFFRLPGRPPDPEYDAWKRNKTISLATYAYYFGIGLFCVSFFIDQLRLLGYLGLYLGLIVYTIVLFVSPPPDWPWLILFKRIIAVIIVLFFGFVVFSFLFSDLLFQK